MSDFQDDDIPQPEGEPAAPYVVGDKRPPKHSQFQKGVSGNSKGRPKGSITLSARIERELRKPITVMKNGKPIKMTKMDVIATQIVDHSMKGDFKATHMVLRLNQQETIAQEAAPPDDANFVIPDKESLKLISKRIGRLAEAE